MATKLPKPIALVICNQGIPSYDMYTHIVNDITKTLEGYRTLVAFQDKPEKEPATIQVFNGDFISDIQFDELKNIINKYK